MALNPWEYAAKTGNEHAHQVALFMWCNMAAKFGPDIANYPAAYSVAGWAKREFEESMNAHGNHAPPIEELFWLHAIKNQGHGDAIRGAKSAQEGVKPGVPDMFLPVPTRFAGLYVELKRPVSVGKSAGRPDPEQIRWQTHLRNVGYAAEVCYGWEAARDCILAYLGLTLPNQ